MKNKDIIEVIKNEIQWSENNSIGYDLTNDYKEGFVKGLNQALYLIKELDKLK